MKLVLTHLRHAPTGGTERVLHQMARRWVARGHEVTVLCRSYHPSGPEETGATFVALRSFAVGHVHRHWAFARDVERWLQRSDAEHDAVLGLGRTWTQDVLRLGGGCHATLVDGLPPLRRLRPKHRLLMALERRIFSEQSTRLFVANAEMVKRDVRARFGLAEERVRVVYNGVDLERFHPSKRSEEGRRLRSEFGLEEDAPVVLFLGTGFRRKGLTRVLEAMPALVSRRPRAQLLVVGHDSKENRYRSHAADLGLDRAVHFLGRRTDAEACYGAADVYVLPTHYDPFANSTLEALASGLPVVTTRSNGGGELIDEGVHGNLLEAPDDPECVSAALDTWLDAQRREEGSRAARQLAEQHRIEDKLDTLEQLLRCRSVHS